MILVSDATFPTAISDCNLRAQALATGLLFPMRSNSLANTQVGER